MHMKENIKKKRQELEDTKKSCSQNKDQIAEIKSKEATYRKILTQIIKIEISIFISMFIMRYIAILINFFFSYFSKIVSTD